MTETDQLKATIKQQLQQKIIRLKQDLELGVSEACKAETRRVIWYYQTKVAEL